MAVRDGEPAAFPGSLGKSSGKREQISCFHNASQDPLALEISHLLATSFFFPPPSSKPYRISDCRVLSLEGETRKKMSGGSFKLLPPHFSLLWSCNLFILLLCLNELLLLLLVQVLRVSFCYTYSVWKWPLFFLVASQIIQRNVT